MKRYLVSPLIIVGLIAVSLLSPALASEWTIDMAHSGIYFDINHIFSATRGNFGEFSGSIRFDPNDLAAGSIQMTVQTQSINTQNTKRDNHLRGDAFFAVSQYPLMTFNSSAFEHKGGDTYMVKGSMTIKDVTRQIEVPFVFHGIKDNPLQKGKQVAGFDARFTIDRLAYHVGDGKYVKMGVIGQDVTVFITLEVLRDK
ncbi:MAG: polyisoprenoid-binding protein [Desulfatitalea sp.]|nr:YceI family protein [Desulfatitalea sp.]NNJ99357.1 polyisoprenoid-binding protein [Desulfatitalea sp.]